MILGESAFEIETGVFRPIWTPVLLTTQLKADIPSLEYESFRTGEVIEMFKFMVRKRNSSRQISARCVLGKSCSNKYSYVEGEYFNPKIRHSLQLTTQVPFVALHTLGTLGSEFSLEGDEIIRETISAASMVTIERVQ